jgi:hypothetical protein
MEDVPEAPKKLPIDVAVLYPRMFCCSFCLASCFWPWLKHFNNYHSSGGIRVDRSVPAVSQAAQAVELPEML